MKRQGSTNFQLVAGVPADVADRARGLTLAVPIGNEVVSKTVSATAKVLDVRASLRTRDPHEARARKVAALVYLEGVWRSLREASFEKPRTQPQPVLPAAERGG